jgi:hypothetical protein
MMKANEMRPHDCNIKAGSAGTRGATKPECYGRSQFYRRPENLHHLP